MPFVFGDHALDCDRRELSRRGVPVAVAPQVFDLLVYLIRNRERVVSKDDLIEAVWGGRIVSDSALTTRINAARTIIGDSGAEQRLIRTVHRRGFRFVGEVREMDQLPLAVREGWRPAIEAAGLVLPDMARPFIADKPSVAVLAFTNMSGSPEREFVAEGIAEDIITALSRCPWLLVIGRNSSFAYKGRAVDLKQVGRQLGARYVLEGSVQSAGERLRVTTQLVDTETGAHIWANRYDRDFADIFAVQDEITDSVTIAIAPAVDEAERRRAMRKPTENIDAWTAFQRGVWHHHKFNPDDNARAQTFFQQAIDLDPTFAAAYCGLAWAHTQAATVLRHIA